MHRLKRKKFNHLILCKDLAVVAGIPPKEKKIVKERVGKIALLAEFAHECRPVALRVRLALRIDNHGKMTVLWRRCAKSLKQFDVLKCVLHMVVTADDVCHTLINIINYVGKMENGRTVAADNCEILNVLGFLGHVAFDYVIKFYRAFLWHAEHYDFAGFSVSRCAFALVSLTFSKQLIHTFKMALHVFSLIELRLVIVEPQPFHAFKKRFDGFRRGAFKIGILNAKEKLAACMTGKQPVVDCGTDVSDMHLPRRRRGKTNSYIFHDGELYHIMRMPTKNMPYPSLTRDKKKMDAHLPGTSISFSGNKTRLLRFVAIKPVKSVSHHLHSFLKMLFAH